jgi:uncharacterized protein with HEPN domain
MQPEDRDIALLWDMREAAREIVGFTHDVTYERFAQEKIRRYAVERQLVVIGEAARRVSDTFKAAHPEIPWRGIVGQRNVLTHEYGEILLDRVWLVATESLPELIRLLDPLIPPPPESDE